MIYLDNAATSFPKPPVVAEAMAAFLTHRAGNPGRSGHSLAKRSRTSVRAQATFRCDWPQPKQT